MFKKNKVKYEATIDQGLENQIKDLEQTIDMLTSKGKNVPQAIYNELSDLKAKRSPNKFGAKKIIYNGIEYDSKREANFAKKLDSSELKYDYQVEVELMPSFELEDEKIKAIRIIVDFLVSSEYFVDVKGITTQHFDDKWKLLKNKFQNSKKYIIAKRESDFDTIISLIRTKGWKEQEISM